VKIVDVEDTFDGLHGFADCAQLKVARRAFEEDVERLADDADGTPEDHGGDEDGEDGVDPGHAGEKDACAARDDGSGGEGVAEHVEEDAADVNVSGEAPEEGGYRAVHQDAGGGDVHHQTRLDGYRCGEAVDGFDGNPGGEDDECRGIDEGCKDAGALVAEGLFVGGGAGLEVDSDEGEEDGEEVGDVVSGLGDEGQGVGAETEEECCHNIGKREHHGDLQDALHFAVRGGDHVHDLSVVRGWVGFNEAFRPRIDTDKSG